MAGGIISECWARSPRNPQPAGRIAGNVAGGLAAAAARSLITGTDFGDNVMAVLPSVIGQTVGGLLADRAARAGSSGGSEETDGGGPNSPTAADNASTTTQGNAAAQQAINDIVVTARLRQSYMSIVPIDLDRGQQDPGPIASADNPVRMTHTRSRTSMAAPLRATG
jgi:hypothetical protein